MAELHENPDGTHTMKGFSTKNPEDLKAISQVIRDKVIKPEEKK